MLRASQTPGELDVVDYPYTSNFAVGLVPGWLKTALKAPGSSGLSRRLEGHAPTQQHAWAGEIAL